MFEINFKDKFANAVESGTKTQTIRRQKMVVAGDIAYLYTGQLTKTSRTLGIGIIKSVTPVDIELVDGKPILYVNNVRLHYVHYESFAKSDGFETVDDFFDFFKGHYGFPFTGILIKWELKGE